MGGVRFIPRSLLALLLLNFAACSSYQTVNVESAMRSSPPPGVDFGSLVRVTPLEGRTDTFRVTEMTPEGVGGNTGFYRYADMKRLQVDKPDHNDDTALTVALTVLGLAALAALIANADSVSVCSPSPCQSPPDD